MRKSRGSNETSLKIREKSSKQDAAAHENASHSSIDLRCVLINRIISASKDCKSVLTSWCYIILTSEIKAKCMNTK